MKTLIFAAKGFETMEFSVFVDVLGWAKHDFGINVSFETAGFQKNVVSTFGVPILVDKTIDEINVDEYDALAIPGGFEDFGFYEEVYDEKFLNLIREFHRQKKIIASICVAALPIAKSGILDGKNATTYHLDKGRRQDQLAEYNVNVINERIVETDNIITSYCPETAVDVAFRLLEKLTSTESMEEVKKGMGY